MIRAIPSIITMLNLLAGCFSILLSFYDLTLAGLLIIVAGVFDFADGMAARLLNAYSEFGKQLDSLADIVSFGVAPSFIMFQLIRLSLMVKNPYIEQGLFSTPEVLILLTSAFPAIFAAIRLARFNISDPANSLFTGVPSPAAGILIASFGYIIPSTGVRWIVIAGFDTTILVLTTVIISLLMIAPIKMITIKFSHFGWIGNQIRYIFAAPSFILLMIIGLKAIPLVILWYLIISAIQKPIGKIFE